MYLVSWHYKVDFRHCNKEKHVGKPVNSSGVLTPDVSGILALQARIPDTSGVSTPEELNDLITCFNPHCPTRQSKR
jgi:aspartate carbamoyltransferase regulatory subunit